MSEFSPLKVVITSECLHFPAYVCEDYQMMKSAKDLFRELTMGIVLNEPPAEIESIAYILLHDGFNITRTQVIAEQLIEWDHVAELKFEAAIARINKGEPVQYVVGKAFFFGREFAVNPSVLIPRPETEELVMEVIRFAGQYSDSSLRMLDIGTGSGCIPVTLAAEIPNAAIIATDVSDRALATARENVLSYKVPVQLLLHNILTQSIPFRDLSVVVSNPPYIAHSEAESMKQNVVDYEPHLALFVDDNDPLIFYKEIAAKAKEQLNAGGLLAFEINERYGSEVVKVLLEHNYQNVELIVDLSGKPRIVKGIKA